jgi:hypothetical protein
MASGALRWGRIVLGGVLAEVLLIAAVIPMRAAGSSEASITILAVAGSFVVFLPVAYGLGRSLARPVLHGVLMGAVAAAIYLTLQVLGQMFAADPPQVPPIYYLGHALKLAGGATGGWLAARYRAARPSTVSTT